MMHDGGGGGERREDGEEAGGTQRLAKETREFPERVKLTGLRFLAPGEAGGEADNVVRGELEVKMSLTVEQRRRTPDFGMPAIEKRW
ncbi:hypothetical protein E2562_003004 [Oryza meyeriana var. granulata]|uniref:Uncharacterized protein n=1 Tax=Oryza meyeriana var. granulata TaxID=110450 RepID=A0A6G1DD77_9ORYZ|nr:hypothetical protein E2562_003004 [Oryza meyeriana var. granulata]